MTATRKPRKRVTTELGRQIMQRERQKLAAEQAKIGEALAQEAANRKRFEEQAQRPKQQKESEQVAVSRALLRRLSAVLASEGLTPAMETRPSTNMKAWTDFRKIHIEYRMHDDLRLLAATLRGLVYHEGGHIRFTVPWVDLREMAGEEEVNGRGTCLRPDTNSSRSSIHRAWNALEDQRMETAVVTDSPRKARYFTPVILTELAHTLDAAAANWPLLVWRRYLPKHIRDGARKLFVTKHNAMGMDGEKVAQQIEHIVTTYVMGTDPVTMYNAVVQMDSMLRQIRPLAANIDDAGHNKHERRRETDEGWDDALTIPVDPSMIEDGDDVADDDDDPVIDPTDPLVASHLAEVFSHLFIDPWVLIPVRYVVEGQSDEEEGEGEGEEGDEESGPQSFGGEDDDDEDADDDGEGDDSEDPDDDFDRFGGGDDDDDDDMSDDDDDMSGGDDADDADDEGDADEGDAGSDNGADEDPESSDSNTGGSDEDEHGPKDDLDQDDLNKAIQDAQDERDNDSALDGDIDAVRDEMDNKASELPVYGAGISDNVESAARAHDLAQRIEDAFHAFTEDRAPQWVEGQKRGVLNVGRYTMSQPWETEYYRQWTDDDAMGYDLSVSVLLDYSYSMNSSTAALAECGYACKLACERLEIPCTVVLWDTSAAVLWDANESPQGLPVISVNGNTDPAMALSDLDNQRGDKSKHLVLVMTDGQWQGGWPDGHRSLATYAGDGRYFVGFGYGSEASRWAKQLSKYGFHQSHRITDLMEIPRHLEDLLIAMV